MRTTDMFTILFCGELAATAIALALAFACRWAAKSRPAAPREGDARPDESMPVRPGRS